MRRANANGYLGAAIGLSVIVFAGFARNYYLREWLGTRPITFRVHIHGLVMTAWVLLFVTQTLLIDRHRVDLHRRLGIAGAALAALVLALGVSTIFGSIERQQPRAGVRLVTELFVAFDGISLLVFASLVTIALIKRHSREVHKRLMLAAMISLLPPAVGRLVACFTHQHVYLIVLGSMYAIVLACLLADGLRRRRVHPAFAFAGLAVLAANQLTYLAQVHSP